MPSCKLLKLLTGLLNPKFFQVMYPCSESTVTYLAWASLALGFSLSQKFCVDCRLHGLGPQNFPESKQNTGSVWVAQGHSPH